MASSGGSLGVSVFLAVILWLAVLIILPAVFLLVGPEELWRMWEDFRAR